MRTRFTVVTCGKPADNVMVIKRNFEFLSTAWQSFHEWTTDNATVWCVLRDRSNGDTIRTGSYSWKENRQGFPNGKIYKK